MGEHMVAAGGGICLHLRRGMDVYNKHFCKKHKKDTDIFHDEFYTNDDIVDAYSHYVATIVKRYANETSVLGTHLSIICCGGRTHLISRLGTRQRSTLFLRSSCIGQLHTSDHY
jgi:hypothetical protein